MRTLTCALLCAAAAAIADSCDSGTNPGHAVDHLEIRLKPSWSSYPIPDTARASVLAFSRDGTSDP